jgi:hypothetical protein
MGNAPQGRSKEVLHIHDITYCTVFAIYNTNTAKDFSTCAPSTTWADDEFVR